MADTTTTNYGLTKPEVGASEDTWGTKINTNLDTLDTTVDSIQGKSGAATLKHTDSAKLTTTATGIDVTGNVTMATGGSIVAGGVNDLILNAGESGTPDIYLQSGSSTKVKIEGSNGNVGIGTSSPNAVIHAVDASGTAVIALDDSRSNVGDTASVEFRHNGITGSLVKSSAVEDFSSSANRSSDLQFWTRNNGTQIQAATIDSSGNVGIGNAVASTLNSQSGYAKLAVGTGSGENGATIYSGSNGVLAFANGTSGTSTYEGFMIYAHADNSMRFGTGHTERMRIDSSGNLLVGTTTTNIATEGTVIYGTGNEGVMQLSSTAMTALYVNRSNEGELVQFRAANVPVGSIGTNGGDLYFSDASYGGIKPLGDGYAVVPSTNSGADYDNAMSLGYPSIRWKDLYLSGTANTAGVIAQPSISGGDALLTAAHTNSNAYVHAGVKINAGNTNPFYIYQSGSSGNLRFNYNSMSDSGGQMILDTSGNLLVGKTANNLTSDGIVLRGGGELFVTRANDVATFNRRVSDGDVIRIAKNAATVGAIRSDAGSVGIGSGNCGLLFYDAGDRIIPRNGTSTSDASLDLGATTDRFKDLYLSGSVGIGASGSVRFNGVSDTTHAVGYDSTIDGSFMRGQNGMRFLTGTGGGSERMRIDSSGNLLVGVTSISDATSRTYGNAFSGSGSNGNWTSWGSGGHTHAIFRNGTGIVGTITTTVSATTYNTSSDQRLKENIADADDAGSKIDAIQVRQYDWKADGSHQDYGMIAQELQAVAPEAVSVPEDSEEMMGVDYSKLVPMLIKEIQSLRNRVAQLEE